jgi:hypothetical protein
VRRFYLRFVDPAARHGRRGSARTRACHLASWTPIDALALRSHGEIALAPFRDRPRTATPIEVASMKLTLSTLLFALLPVARASADEVVHELQLGSDGLFVQRTVDFPSFDPSLGTLQRVELDVDVAVDGLVGVENLSANLCTADLQFLARVRAALPGARTSDEIVFGASAQVALLPYDGVRDFDGPSGRRLPASITEQCAFSCDSGLDAYVLSAEHDHVAVPIAVRGGLRIAALEYCGMRASLATQLVLHLRYVYAPHAVAA